jgi:hypothetical protein
MSDDIATISAAIAKMQSQIDELLSLVKAPKKPEPSKKVKTEDTGKMFEKAICNALGIAYDGNYKYCQQMATTLAETGLSKLKDYVPSDLKHTARKRARYDFTSASDNSKHLSAKSTKGGCGKVAAQVIGQTSPRKFCEMVGIPFDGDLAALKQQIQTQIVRILPHLVAHTFDCPTLYYNQGKSSIRYVELVTPIDWSTYTYTWTCPFETWSNSSTLKIAIGGQEIGLVEFQFHTKSRSNMAIRWAYDNFLDIFKDHLRIVNLM